MQKCLMEPKGPRKGQERALSGFSLGPGEIDPLGCSQVLPPDQL